MTGVLLQSDGSSTAVDPTKWISCSTLEQPHHGANSVSRTVWEANPVELEWTSGRPRFITMGSTQIFMRTCRGVNVSGDLQIAPKTTGLQRSIIGKLIVFHRSCGTLFNKVTGTQIKFERAGGAYRLKGRDISTEWLGQVEPRC